MNEGGHNGSREDRRGARGIERGNSEHLPYTGRLLGRVRAAGWRSRGTHGLADLRDECLNETLFTSLPQARAVLAAWQQDYSEVRPQSGLNGRTPASIRLPPCSPASGLCATAQTKIVGTEKRSFLAELRNPYSGPEDNVGLYF